MNSTGALCALAAATALLASCGRAEAPLPQAAATATPAAAAGTSAMPHGDHNPHHGGIVMMKGDLHYEVVVDPSGKAHHLYFTDAVRDDLPASVASAATLTIHRPGAEDETIPLSIDETGESWVGSGKAVEAGPKTSVRVAFTLHDDTPYWIDLPLAR